MKLLTTVLTIIIVTTTTVYCQESNKFIEHVNNFLEVENNSPIIDNYLLFKSKNSFTIIELNDSKINDYPVLNSIEYKIHPSDNYSLTTPENFVILFNNQTINQLLLNVKRDRFSNLYYRLGSSNYVLVGSSEEKLYSEYNKLNK